MSYNTRSNMAGGPYGRGRGHAAVGQRRPAPPMNNFVPSGQLVPQRKPLIQMPARQQQQQQQQPPPQQQQQQQHPVQQQQNHNQPPQAQQKPPVQPQQNIQQQPQQPQQQQQQQQQQPQVPPAPPLKTEEQLVPPNFFSPDVTMKDESAGDAKEKRPKPFWLRNGAGKISKKEKLRRRNQKLRKILQPKNALMVLHELLESYTYNCSETGEMTPFKETVFKATVNVDGIEHVGTGKNKIAAKTAAAEEAIKYLVLKRLKSTEQTPASIVSEMETDGEQQGGAKLEDNEDGTGTFSWQHIACFALHKLFTSWDDTVNFTEKLSQSSLEGQLPEKKPAKKLPANAESMNPIMLLNQMYPQVKYVELSRVGNPPNTIFTYQCSIGDKNFTGTGSNKKSAKKLCAFAACTALLGIKYPQEVYPPVESN